MKKPMRRSTYSSAPLMIYGADADMTGPLRIVTGKSIESQGYMAKHEYVLSGHSENTMCVHEPRLTLHLQELGKPRARILRGHLELNLDSSFVNVGCCREPNVILVSFMCFRLGNRS